MELDEGSVTGRVIIHTIKLSLRSEGAAKRQKHVKSLTIIQYTKIVEHRTVEDISIEDIALLSRFLGCLASCLPVIITA